MKACLRCGNLIADEARFCDQCGTPASLNRDNYTTPPVQTPTPPREPKKRQDWCAFCQGKGYIGDNVFGKKCPTCHGARVNQISENAHQCNLCGGSGRAKGTTFMGPSIVPCPGCHGTGWVE